MQDWSGKPLGSFETWSQIMGGILEDAEIEGFLENLKGFRATSSNEVAQDRIMISALFNEESFTVGKRWTSGEVFDYYYDEDAEEFELDLDLRPEGKNGPIVRSIDSYAAYYKRWAGTWESQALLRARLVSGAPEISKSFVELINQYRYPEQIEQAAIIEIRRIKARVEVERLPQGADPKRHLKLGRGSISDVEWLVQLFQLKYASSNPAIQTPHTLLALEQLEASGIINNSDARVLKEAWVIASSIRSSAMLYLNKRTDVLPADRQQLEGIARLTGYPRGGASALEQDYLAATRRGRMVFEKLFFD
jgi:glutamate-ammonia-ligase adenylyltransferase